MELGDGSGLTSLKILEIETAHQIIVTPDVLRNQMDLIVVIEFTAFFGPISVTHGHTILHKTGQHNNDDTTLLPNHLQTKSHQFINCCEVSEILIQYLPEIGGCVLKRSLCCDVGWISRVVVSLTKSMLNPKEIP